MKALILLATALILPNALAQVVQVNVDKNNRTIAITTNDQAQTLADVAVVSIGFSNFGNDQDSTYSDATRISNAIMKSLTDAGIKPAAIQSAEQNLSALDENDKLRYAKGIRFHFSQSWRVTVPAAAASDTLHAAILSGANDSGNIQWELANDDALEAEAAEKALTHARQIAERMATGLHTKLGDLVYASNQTPPRGILGAMMLQTESAAMGGRIAKNLKPLAISPEKITKTATVYAVFAIQ